jgi:epoxyqueuosine reductase
MPISTSEPGRQLPPAMSEANRIIAILRAEARSHGLDAIGIARLDDLGTQPGVHLAAFLAHGRHGDMTWMAAQSWRRSHPRNLWPEAKSAVVLALSYAPAEDPLRVLGEPNRAAISVYAKGRDYHDVLKSRLKLVATRLAAETRCDVKVFVDTAPLMEKPIAALAGVGWQGKHTNLVSRTHGSWLFLGVILTTADLVPDAPARDRCGTCRRCLDVCPTGAFPAPYELDARRCIAYLTIEHKGPIPRELRPAMGNRVFGCDDCLAVCPWNKFAATAREARFAARSETDNPALADLLALDDKTFRQRFAGTPVKRTGRDRVVRNAAIAAGNSGDETLLASLERLLCDASPLVRGAAIWAIARLAGPDRVAALATKYRAREPDRDARAEWDAECAS